MSETHKPYVPSGFLFETDYPAIQLELVSYNVAEFNLDLWLSACRRYGGIDALHRLLTRCLSNDKISRMTSFDGIREQIKEGDKVFVFEQWSVEEYQSGRRYLNVAEA